MPFNPITDPVDYILLAGQRSPGIATITGASSPRRWDKRKGYAQTGARVVFRGVDLASFMVTFKLLTPADFDAWHEWSPLVQRPPIGARGRAMDIWHPILEDLGIKSVVVEDVGQPRQTDEGWLVDVKFIEYRKPLPRVQPINGSEAQRPYTELELDIIENTANIRYLNDPRNFTNEEARQLALQARANAEAQTVAAE